MKKLNQVDHKISDGVESSKCARNSYVIRNNMVPNRENRWSLVTYKWAQSPVTNISCSFATANRTLAEDEKFHV